MLEGLLPERSAEDFASGVIRVTLGHREVILEELPMEQMDAWSDRVDAQLADLLNALDDGAAPTDVMASLAKARPLVIEALCSYPGVPPVEELRATASHGEVLRALMGVWTAANPLVGTLVEGLLVLSRAQQTRAGNASELMSTLLRISDGRSGDSAENSPTASSPSDSTPSTSDGATTTRPPSKRRGRATSSPASPRPTIVGSDGSTGLTVVPGGASSVNN